MNCDFSKLSEDQAWVWAADVMWPKALELYNDDEPFAEALVNTVLLNVFKKNYPKLRTWSDPQVYSYFQRCLLHQFFDEWPTLKEYKSRIVHYDFSDPENDVGSHNEDMAAREAREMIEKIRIFVNGRFPEKQRNIFFSRVEYAMKYKEISDEFNVSVDYAKVIVSKIRKDLRNGFKGD